MNTKLNTTSTKIEALEIETLNAIYNGQKEKVKQLFTKVEHLFTKGSNQTRSLIANKFIFPLTQLLEMNYSWGREYLNLMPNLMKAEYCRQIYSSGI